MRPNGSGSAGQRCFVHRLVNGSLVWLAVRLAGFVVNRPMPTTGSNRAVPAVTGPTMAEAVPSRDCRAQPLKSLSVGTLHSDSTMYQQPKAPYVLCFKPVIRWCTSVRQWFTRGWREQQEKMADFRLPQFLFPCSFFLKLNIYDLVFRPCFMGYVIYHARKKLQALTILSPSLAGVQTPTLIKLLWCCTWISVLVLLFVI